MDNLYLNPGLSADLIGPGTTPTGMAMGINNPYMNYAYNTNFLGGITMQGALPCDVYSGASIKCREAKNRTLLKNVVIGSLLGVGGLFVMGKFGKLFRAIGKVFKK